MLLNSYIRYDSSASIKEKTASLTLASSLYVSKVQTAGRSGFSSAVGSLRGVPLCELRRREINR